MGASILPACIHNNRLYFLFGKENKYNDTPGFSDFGGGRENNELPITTAAREGSEETTGFLGSGKDIMKMMKKRGVYKIDYKITPKNCYRVHIFPYKYDPMLPFYYNNNQKFIQDHIPNVVKNTKIFEKSELRWISADELPKMKSQFRNFYRGFVPILYDNRHNIKRFISKSEKKIIHPPNTNTRRSNKKSRNKTRKLL